MIEAGGNLRLRLIGAGNEPAAQPVGTLLQPVGKIGLIHLVHTNAHRVGGAVLGLIELVDGGADLLLQLRDAIGKLLPLSGQCVEIVLGHRRLRSADASAILLIHLLGQPRHLLFLLALLLCQLAGFVGHLANLLIGLLLLQGGEHVHGVAKTLSGLLAVGAGQGRRSLIFGSPHGLGGLTQLVKRRLRRLLRAGAGLAIGARLAGLPLLAALAPSLSRLSYLLACLPGLSLLLSRLSLLARLSRRLLSLLTGG